MFIFQLMYKDSMGTVYFSEGIYVKQLMDIFSWDVMKTISTNMLEIIYPNGHLEYVGMQRNLELENYAKENFITFEELQCVEEEEMVQFINPELEFYLVKDWHIRRKLSVEDFLYKLRKAGNMPSNGRPARR